MSLTARVGQAIFWGQTGRVAEAAVFFLFYLFLARVLGPTSYGVFAVGMSFAGACVFLTLFGLGPETLGRFVPEIAAGGRRDRARRLLGMLLAVRCTALFAASGALLLFSRGLGGRFHFPLAAESLALVLVVFAARSIFDLLTFFSAGLLELKRVAAAKVIAAVAAPSLFLFCWFRHMPGANAAWLAAAGSSLAGIIVLAAPFLPPTRAGAAVQIDPLPLRRILAFGMFAWATNFFVYILGDNMDVLLLGWLVSDRAAIGQYAVGAKIVFSLTALLLGWVTLVSVASLSEAWQRGGIVRLASVVEAQWKLGVLCVVAPLLLLLRFAPEIISIFYSPAYAPSVAVIRVLCGLMICGVLCGFSIQGGILYTLDHERIACAAVGLVAVFNIVGEIFLVRRMGIMGAAWTTGFSFVLVAIISTAIGAFYVPFHFPGQFIGSVAAAASIGVASTLWLQPASVISLLAASALCGGLFFGCLAVLKPLSAEDSAELHRVNGLLGTWSEKLFCAHSRGGERRMTEMAHAGGAFRALLDFRRWIQRTGIDRLAPSQGKLGGAFRGMYRAAYGTLQPSDMITVKLGENLVSIDPGQRDLALLLRKRKVWERQQTLLFESLLTEGMVFVDVGAHIGYYALLAARSVGAGGKVFAFEPAPDNFRVLAWNIAQNAFTNVVAESLAVARRRGRASFALSGNDSASHSLAATLHNGRRIEVGTISLDEYFSEIQVRIDVVKLDAEGAELEILEGMQRVLARNPDLILFTEIYPRAMEALGNSPEEFLAKLAGLGFSITPFEEERPSEQPLGPHDIPAFLDGLRARKTGTNLFCRRKENAAHSVAAAADVPLISVAIPTYNRGALLERALESISPQIAADVEIVVYDTGSTDDTAERMARLSAGNPALRFMALQERQSLDETLLLLLDACVGEYVWFFSSDDQMKPGAIEAVRQRILGAPERPALVYVNQEISDDAERTLIASQVGRTRDRDFLDGRKIVPWLAVNLGFISASLIRRKSALRLSSAREFIGTRSLNLHLYLGCLLEGGAALYIGEPFVQARRATGHPPYEYRDVFVRDITRILQDAQHRGFGFWPAYRTMHRIVAGQYLRLVVSWRADDPTELAQTFPAMVEACWMFPAFWLLVVPARFAPRAFVRGIRNRLRIWRERDNDKRRLNQLSAWEKGNAH